MKKHVNIPIFIPHFGCRNSCVFCNQKKITGKPCYDRQSVLSEINTALETINTDVTETELAFFGGSFTAIPEDEMLWLLKTAAEFIQKGKIQSVRLSTRPDAVDERILGILRMYGVKTVELGLQSFSDKVLSASKRGHTSSDSVKACQLVKQFGFELVGQMMVGLPSSTPEDELYTANEICRLGCDGARIYPTVVFPDTELMKMQQAGDYIPLTTEQATVRCSDVLEVFIENNVKVIRIGLCSNETLASDIYLHSYHPAVGELAINRYYLRKMCKLLENDNSKEKIPVFAVAKGKISQAVGQKRSNAGFLIGKFGLTNIKVIESDLLQGFGISLIHTERNKYASDLT